MSLSTRTDPFRITGTEYGFQQMRVEEIYGDSSP